MKTLVIHPQDSSTNFLKICYENHESIYSVSSYGRIRNDKRNKIHKNR